MTTAEIIRQAKQAVPLFAGVSKDRKNFALICMAEALEDATALILAENEKDIENARGRISEVMLDRLMLNEKRIRDMADGIRAVASLPDPVGRVLDERMTADGLQLRKVAVPFGVVAIIYESRPNVTSDAAALCIKSGNVCILRSGKEAHRSAWAITCAIRQGLMKAGLSEDLVWLIEDTGRESALELMKARGYVDLLIPRGSAGLIKACVDNASVPVIETGTGICSIFVDKTADIPEALAIVDNAKTQRPSVCNACETLLVHEQIAEAFLPRLEEKLVGERSRKGLVPVELRLCEKAIGIIPGTPASTEDYDTEFLDYVLAVKIVSDVREAVSHIGAHSTHHSDAILTKDDEAAVYFTTYVDSAAVYVNASTRFTDGGCFGLGCEMGISTQKLHTRGPMGLQELTSYKYIVRGNGQVRK